MTSRSNILDQPEIMPLPHEDWAGSSSLSISIVEGPTLNLWSIATATEDKTKNELTLHLQPDQSVVIGRQEGGRIEYLDPRYQPTQMLPNSNKRVVTSFNRGSDRSVSRGHFMLRGSVHGILFVNGVPRRGGGIRPPKNGTQMLAPCHRNQKMTKELPDTEETHANSYAMPAVPAGDEIVVGRSVLCLACRNVFLFTIEAPAPLDQFANLFERLMLHNGAHLRAGRQQFR